jgi:hypothetical protein
MGMYVVTPYGVVGEYTYLSINPEDGASMFIPRRRGVIVPFGPTPQTIDSSVLDL